MNYICHRLFSKAHAFYTEKSNLLWHIILAMLPDSLKEMELAMVKY